ncbi:hypothetical protein ACJRO7_003838 [Eucalyptus globulus]|uniref:Exoribonuclease phosphorolytic domain-containing protein n=1 Tax=Eucalyptus globulus TaxID=34317 RepID=A0ABD3IXX2_EUCGL
MPRRSGRNTRPPTWTKDYICTASKLSGTHYPISAYVSFQKLSTDHMCCIISHECCLESGEIFEEMSGTRNPPFPQLQHENDSLLRCGLCNLFGHRENKKAMMYSDMGRLKCNVRYTTFATVVRGQKESSSMLHKASEGAIKLETFAKTTVDVFCTGFGIWRNDLLVVISCASLALADAGIMLYGLVAVVSVICSCLGLNLVIDPISEEESHQDGSLMITWMPSRYEVTQLTITGEWSSARINEAMQLCHDACSKRGKVMRSCLKEAASASEEI